MIEATHAKIQHNNYYVTECTHIPSHPCNDDDGDDDDDDDLYIIGAVCDVFAYFAFLPFLDTFGSRNKRKVSRSRRNNKSCL